jgi:hypothetical protein
MEMGAAQVLLGMLFLAAQGLPGELPFWSGPWHFDATSSCHERKKDIAMKTQMDLPSRTSDIQSKDASSAG